MADFYQEMRDMAEELLAPTAQNGLGQVGIKLHRRTKIEPANSWDMPTFSNMEFDIKGAARHPEKEMIGLKGLDGSLVKETDIMVTMAPPPSGIQAGDTISVNGQSVVLLLLRPIPAAGPPVVYKAILRT